MTRVGRVARVLIDSPLPQLDHLFDYRIPSELETEAVPGVRVRVPFGGAGRIVDGFLIEVVDEAAAAPGQPADGSDGDAAPASGESGPWRGALSPLDSVVSPVPVLTRPVWELARKVADRAAGTASDVIRLAVPPRQVRVEKAWMSVRVASGAGQDDAGRREPGPPATAPPPGVGETGETGETAVPPAEDGWAAPRPRFHGYADGALPGVLAGRRRAAVQAVPRLATVPGGGTVGQWALTLAELAVATVASGRSAIIAVPDYRDQDQVQDALAHLDAGDAVARVDARQSNPDRYRAFLSCLTAEPRIILGSRSAVYAPAPHLGLIALWDDGDPLHAEPLSPYVHARDVALVRQQDADCALVLLGHSRSVDAQRLVELGWLDDVRPAVGQHPRVIPTEFQPAAESPARAARIPSAAWQAARAALADGPVLVQVASPGYAPVLACRTCSHPARCARCQGPLGLASAEALPACRWCGALAAAWACSHCEGHSYRMVSVGAGRTAEELGRAFPGTPVLRSDGEHPVQAVGDEPALVIATRGAEPVARGGYRAVLLLDGERMLARESLRVAEDCLRWWSNAAALAAPGAPVMLAGVAGPLARALNSWQQSGFAAAELADRRSLRFPPAVRVASVAGSSADVDAALADLTGIGGIDVLGPVETEPGLMRAIVRLPYASGEGVARSLKASVVRNATRRRKPRGSAIRPAPTLKVRFDDPELL